MSVTNGARRMSWQYDLGTGYLLHLRGSVYGRGTPMRDTSIRWPLCDELAYERHTYEMAPVRGTPVRGMPMRCTPMRDKPMRWPMGEIRL